MCETTYVIQIEKSRFRRSEREEAIVYIKGRACSRWYKTGNCAVEAVDLGRGEEQTRGSNEGDKRGSSCAAAFLSLSLFFHLSVCLSVLFPSFSKESSTRENFDSLESLRSSRSYIVFSSHLRSSSSAVRSGNEKSFSFRGHQSIPSLPNIVGSA